MATNQNRWLLSLAGATSPYRALIQVAAGSSTPLKRGEIGKVTSGVVAAATSGDTTGLVIVDQEQAADDVARFIWCIVPRPLDVFEYTLSAARAVKLGETLAISDSETLAYATSNVVARVATIQNVPRPEEESTTRGSLTKCGVVFDEQASYLAELTGNS